MGCLIVVSRNWKSCWVWMERRGWGILKWIYMWVCMWEDYIVSDCYRLVGLNAYSYPDTCLVSYCTVLYNVADMHRGIIRIVFDAVVAGRMLRK